MKFIFKLIVGFLKLFSPRYYVMRKLSDPKQQDREDAEKLMKTLRGKDD